MSPSCRSRPERGRRAGARSRAPRAPGLESRSAAARASRSSRKSAGQDRVGSRPSSAQKARNEANRLLVSTPPKSSRSRARRSARHGRCASRALRRARRRPRRTSFRYGSSVAPDMRALVVALHEDDRLPQRQRLVPADVGHRAPGALLVAGDQLLARAGTRPRAVTPEQVEVRPRVAGLDPHASSGSRGRPADRRSWPSPSRGSPPAGPARWARTWCCPGGSRRGRRSPGGDRAGASASQRPTALDLRAARACGCAPTARRSGAAGARGSRSACRSPRARRPASRPRAARRARRSAPRAIAAAVLGVVERGGQRAR